MKPKRAQKMLKRLGWTTIEGVAPDPKCIILGAPHTSFWDFIISYLYYQAIGGTASVMIKKSLFFWPLGPILRSLGAIPVDRSNKSASLVREIIKAFEEREFLHLALAPEGTRKPVTKWKAGFHKMAKAANVPVYLGYFDWGKKEVGRGEKFELTDDVAYDLKRIRQWYKDKGVVGKHPKKFVTGDDLA